MTSSSLQDVYYYIGKVEKRIDSLEDEVAQMVEANNAMVDELARLKQKNDNLTAIFYDLFPELNPNRFGTLTQKTYKTPYKKYKYDVLEVNEY